MNTSGSYERPKVDRACYRSFYRSMEGSGTSFNSLDDFWKLT